MTPQEQVKALAKIAATKEASTVLEHMQAYGLLGGIGGGLAGASLGHLGHKAIVKELSHMGAPVDDVAGALKHLGAIGKWGGRGALAGFLLGAGYPFVKNIIMGEDLF